MIVAERHGRRVRALQALGGALLVALLAACNQQSANPCAGITDPTEQKACQDRQLQKWQQQLQQNRPPGR